MVEMVGDQTADQAAKAFKKGEKKNVGEMVGDQITNQAAKPLKKGGEKKKKKSLVLEQ
jgi:hypothetical protein